MASSRQGFHFPLFGFNSFSESTLGMLSGGSRVSVPGVLCRSRQLDSSSPRHLLLYRIASF